MPKTTKKTKEVTMTVTVRCPDWLTAAQARKEVRSLIKDQVHWGHEENASRFKFECIDEYNFKVVSVKGARA
jgi:hypothetical protein